MSQEERELAQTDQSFTLPSDESLLSYISIKRTAKTLTRLSESMTRPPGYKT